MIIYKITNKINNKIYIGMTIRDLESRWKAHISASINGSTFRFHKAIKKYGIDNWIKEILFKSDNINEIRKKEADLILSMNSMNFEIGYNSKPGGCGGWIVPEDKLESWKLKLSNKCSGKNNPNASLLSNDELFKYACEYIEINNKIATSSELNKYCIEKCNKSIPKSWTKYRFGGYSNFIKILEEKYNLKYNKSPRIKGCLSPYSKSNKNKIWISSDKLLISKMCEKDQLEESLTNGWIKGRKYGNKN